MVKEFDSKEEYDTNKFKKRFNVLIEANYFVNMTPNDLRSQWIPYLTSLPAKSDSKGRRIRGEKQLFNKEFEQKYPNLLKSKIKLPAVYFFETWIDKRNRLIEIESRLT